MVKAKWLWLKPVKALEYGSGGYRFTVVPSFQHLMLDPASSPSDNMNGDPMYCRWVLMKDSVVVENNCLDRSLQEFCQCLEVISQLGSMTAAAGFPWGRPDKFPMWRIPSQNYEVERKGNDAVEPPVREHPTVMTTGSKILFSIITSVWIMVLKA